MKRIFFFVALLLACTSESFAWNIGSKGSVIGPSIHTTYFLTPNNASFPVHAQAYVGTYVNGICNYAAIYDIGTDNLKTGDYVDIDAFQLKSVIGTNYNCMTIYYTYKQLVMETFLLLFDGINYNNSAPTVSEVMISLNKQRELGLFDV